jgi:hydrogenase-1 operon protein HyaE
MPSPLIRKLVDEYHCPELDEKNIDVFLQQHHDVLLFFTENPKQFPESNDVAVVLPELMKIYTQLKVALVSQNSQRTLQARFGFNSWPSLVFLRDGEYLGVISQIQNWDDYLHEFNLILNSAPSRLPVFKIAVVSEMTSCQNH